MYRRRLSDHAMSTLLLGAIILVVLALGVILKGLLPTSVPAVSFGGSRTPVDSQDATRYGR